MKRVVLRRFLVTSKKISNTDLQKFISTYFPMNKTNTVYKDVLISRERNKRKQ